MRKLIGAVVMVILSQACSDDPAKSTNAATRTDAAVARDAGEDTDAGASVKIDRGHLSDTGTSDPLDYSDPALWVCRPGNDPNECYVNLDATEIAKDGTRTVVPHVRAPHPEFDCFYIYPTVAVNGGGNMTDFSDISPVLDPLLAQAARFNSVCEVYAPLYRQVSLSTDSSGVTTIAGDGTLAVNDVLAAFDYFISKLSHGRKFAILGHSQGSSMGIALLKQRIDNDDALRARMISAVLLGGAPVVPDGKQVGGSFANIPACTSAGQTGCLIAYSTYDQMAPPDPSDAKFGRSSDAGRIICTEPAQLAKNESGRYRGSYFPLKSHNPSFVSPGYSPTDLTTDYMLYRDYFHGECVQKGDFNYLELSISKTSDDQRETPPYRNPTLEQTGWGLHLVDYNPELDDLIDAVSLSAAAAKR
jgi:pimeloyl-ACP methyl ester carboxylesterase